MKRIALLGLLLAALPATADAKLRAGAATADITPPIGTPMFAYTDRSRVFDPTNNADLLQVLADPDQHLYAKTFIPSKGVHMRLRARSVVIDRDGEPFALVQVDLGGIPYAVTRAVAARVASLGITQDRLLISATHTHAGHGAIWPWEDNAAYGFVGGDVFDGRIFRLTVDGITESITKAFARRKEARVGVGSVDLAGASRNRAGEAFDRNQAKPTTSYDPTLTVIRVDSAKGKPVAVWSNFAIHPTAISDPILSGDNPGVTARLVEREIGRGVVNVWTNGNQGDISPNGGSDRIGDQDAEYVQGGMASAHRAGERVAAGVLAAWKDARPRLDDDIELKARQGFMAMDGTMADGEPVGPIPVLGASVVAENPLTCAPVDNAAGPGQGRKMFLFGAPGIVPGVAPVSIWQVGDLGIVATPSEVTWTAGKRIRDAVAAVSGGAVKSVITAGLTDAYLSYTATPEEYDACGYEGGMTLFGRQQQGRYRDYARDLAASLFTGARLPVTAPEPAQTGLAFDPVSEPRETADPGAVVEEPAADVTRLSTAVFRWQGGDRAVDAPRGKTFVRLQRRHGANWRTVATDDSFADVVMRQAGDVYAETFRFDECTPVGEYRFEVTGRAVQDGQVVPYRSLSRMFRVSPATLKADQPVVSGGIASVRALYPNPGPDTIVALPRIATTGAAELLVDGAPVTAVADPATGTYTAPVAPGASVSLVRVEDACGNASA